MYKTVWFEVFKFRLIIHESYCLIKMIQVGFRIRLDFFLGDFVLNVKTKANKRRFCIKWNFNMTISQNSKDECELEVLTDCFLWIAKHKFSGQMKVFLHLLSSSPSWRSTPKQTVFLRLISLCSLYIKMINRSHSCLMTNI